VADWLGAKPIRRMRHFFSEAVPRDTHVDQLHKAVVGAVEAKLWRYDQDKSGNAERSVE